MRIFRAKLEANRKSNQSPVDRKCRIKQDVDWPAGVSETATIEVENRKKRKENLSDYLRLGRTVRKPATDGNERKIDPYIGICPPDDRGTLK